MLRLLGSILRAQAIISGALLQGANAMGAIYVPASSLQIPAASAWAETLYPAAEINKI